MHFFRITESDLETGQREIQVEGQLDLAVADQLGEAIGRSPSKQTLIDLTDCDFIDSTGLAVIVRANQRAKETGYRVVVHSPSDQVLRLLEITGLTANGLVFASREEALADSSSTG